jgi:hypothetical protein
MHEAKSVTYFLRRHYPDQVYGYNLSIPVLTDSTPITGTKLVKLN